MKQVDMLCHDWNEAGEVAKQKALQEEELDYGVSIDKKAIE